jgi:hypothetical protein
VEDACQVRAEERWPPRNGGWSRSPYTRAAPCAAWEADVVGPLHGHVEEATNAIGTTAGARPVGLVVIAARKESTTALRHGLELGLGSGS